LQYRDELMGFLKNLEKQGHEGDRAFYLESWNGNGSYSYDRIGRGSLFMPSNTMSILGGIQPFKIASFIRDFGSGENDDGLVPRFQLAVYPDTDMPYVPVTCWADPKIKADAHALFENLAKLDLKAIGAEEDAFGGFPFLRFTEDAQSLFNEWRTNLERRVRTSTESAHITSHLAKYRSLMPSLALHFHLVEVVSEIASGPVSLSSTERAAAWCDYVEEHARRIYQSAWDGDIEPATQLADRIKSGLKSPFTARDVQQKGWRSLSSKEEVEMAISMLEDHGWLVRREVPSKPGSGGRPTDHFYINPAVQNEEES